MPKNAKQKTVATPKKATATAETAADTAISKGPEYARTVIYVHGIGNKPRPEILKCQWDTALFGFDVGERSRLAYWVNRAFYPTPEAATCGSGDKIELESGPTGQGLSVKQHLETATIDEEVDAVATPHSDKRALKQIATAIVERGEQPQRVSVESVDAKVLPLPRPIRDWIARQLMRAFLRDVNDYFYVTERRDVMRRSLLERLQAGGGPFVVIAHSQGSMIAYDVLHELEPDAADVVLFVTIGSPLGITEVQDQIGPLTKQKKDLTVPACVTKWINFADPGDPVAIDSTLADEYAPREKITDEVVTNLDSPKHPHSGTGYLGHPAVRELVRRALDTNLFQRVAPFVIARDLVRDLENAPELHRHKTLIELSAPSLTDVRSVEDRRLEVMTLLSEAARKAGADEADLRIEQLKRFVAADLTRAEAESLASIAGAGGKSVERIWRNAAKKSYIDASIDTVQARTAHAGYNARGKGIEWAVLDTGIVPHPHFDKFKNVVAKFDCTVRGALKPAPAVDDHGHGTHVAGIIAGTFEALAKDNSKTVFSGLAPEANLHIYKVLDRNGEGEDAWIIKALDHIADVNDSSGGIRIQGVNLSLGGNFDPSVYGCGHSPLCSELRRLWRQGVVVVLAAGNEGYAVLQTDSGTVDANMDISIGDPANLEESIAVGSVHKQNPHTYGVSYFSSRGPTADGRQKPDLVAPGERINSCRHDFQNSSQRIDDLYVAMSGTSMAAPHVSGIVASFLSARKEFIGYPDKVKELLLQGCTDLRRDRPQQGAGMPNLTRMLLNT